MNADAALLIDMPRAKRQREEEPESPDQRKVQYNVVITAAAKRTMLADADELGMFGKAYLSRVIDFFHAMPRPLRSLCVQPGVLAGDWEVEILERLLAQAKVRRAAGLPPPTAGGGPGGWRPPPQPEIVDREAAEAEPPPKRTDGTAPPAARHRRKG